MWLNGRSAKEWARGVCKTLGPESYLLEGMGEGGKMADHETDNHLTAGTGGRSQGKSSSPGLEGAAWLIRQLPGDLSPAA
ncbi:MAG: hypothetical protein NVSMB9_04470 [Isosphaeraceae bacterium]